MAIARLLKSIQLLLIAYLFLGATALRELLGRVIKVADGDTITILIEGRIQEKIRFTGIDCPEKNQAFGSQAKTFTSDRCFGKNVRIAYESKDRYGRILGIVYLPDGKNLNKELLRAGLAWHYKQFDDSQDLAKLEVDARVAKRGLWSDAHPVAPWDFRKSRRSD
ncbi:MAG: thermonuclease family protein [Bacteroidota bacterium]